MRGNSTFLPGMSLKRERCSKWNVTQNGMSLQKACHLKKMSFKMECHSKLNFTQSEMLLKMECHSKWNVTQNGMSIKMEYHSKWNVTQNGMSR